MWKSPIEIIYDIHNDMQKQIEQIVEKEVRYLIGVNVDKEELVKALDYDRDQYNKGYADAKDEQSWIPCIERLPEERGRYLVTGTTHFLPDHVDDPDYIDDDVRMDYFSLELGWHSGEKNTAWMPLPEPYKAKE